MQLIFLVGGFVLAAALVPTILAGGGPVLSTCLLTGGILAAYTFAFYRMKQYWSTLGTALSASAWAILGVQAWVS